MLLFPSLQPCGSSWNAGNMPRSLICSTVFMCGPVILVYFSTLPPTVLCLRRTARCLNVWLCISALLRAEQAAMVPARLCAFIRHLQEFWVFKVWLCCPLWTGIFLQMLEMLSCLQLDEHDLRSSSLGGICLFVDIWTHSWSRPMHLNCSAFV